MFGSPFFEQFIYGTAVVDYAVEEITVVPSKASDVIMNQVHLTRLSDGVFPQEIEIVFDNGIVELVEWDGRERDKMLTFERPAAIEEVHLDPENKTKILDLLFAAVDQHDTTLLAVTHDHESLGRFDRIIERLNLLLGIKYHKEDE